MKLDLFSECVDGHYNKSGGCSQQCGHCAETAFCDKNTGYCPSCEPGWIFPLCQQRKSFYCFILLYIFIQSPSPPPPSTISATSTLAANIDSLSELFATCRMLTSVSGPCTCRNDLPLPLPKKPSPGPFTFSFQAFLFLCYVFPSHAASFLRRKLLLTV